MSYDLVWLIAGLVLVVAELMSGTFYLLVLGLAALIGALAAHFGLELVVQAAIAAVVAAAGVLVVRSRQQRLRGRAMPSSDLGQTVTFDAWSNQAAAQARVRYRNTQWDAEIEGDPQSPVAGDAFHIVAVHGSTLRIARKP